jgi:hypothetical protein
MDGLPRITSIMERFELASYANGIGRKRNDCFKCRAGVSLTATAMAQAAEHRFACHGIADLSAQASTSQFPFAYPPVFGL